MMKVSRVRGIGPLAVHADGFEAELARVGYSPLSAANLLGLMAHVSRWLLGRGLGCGDFTDGRIEEYLESRREAGYTCWLTSRGLSPLVGYLRGLGVVPAASVPARTGLDDVLDGYRGYLTVERGLADSTVVRNVQIAGVFLAAHLREHEGRLELEVLTGVEVTSFVGAQCERRSVGSAKLLVTGLRSFLRYLHVAGLAPGPLAGAVLAVAGWRGGSLPRALPPEQVRALLASCDRRRGVGRRDFAILVVLSRLGLRAGEVAAIGLDDIDWRAGELMVRGKGRREERLPIPDDVGEAIVGYLRRGRGADDQRSLFLRVRAPRGPLTAAAVKRVVSSAGLRAGLPGCSPHRLRHSTAVALLASGSSLPEIAQVLRHRSLSTTAIYAKVDDGALRPLALPWPGGAA